MFMSEKERPLFGTMLKSESNACAPPAERARRPPARGPIMTGQSDQILTSLAASEFRAVSRMPGDV
jgi:hypothetical protein